MKLLQKAQHYLIKTYAKYPVEIVKGKGSFVWDAGGKKYLDFYGGHAVCLLGHCNPAIVNAISKQCEKILFYSNVFHTAPAILLAEKLARTLAPKQYQVYFTNSGSEANETAIKIARNHTGKTHIISFKNSFHGRGIAALSATGIGSYHIYKPNLDAFTSFAELGNMRSVRAAWKANTAAVICEPIQSIGGVNTAETSFYKALAKFCGEKNILLIFDEVQTGLGRTGYFWFAERAGIWPHIITTAKGLGGGIPLAAVIVSKKISERIKIGDHATTFGGGPVQTAAGLATVNCLFKKGFLASVSKKESNIRSLLKGIKGIRRVKGKGLLLGVELASPRHDIVKKCLAAGLIIASSKDPNVFRIMPPLTVSKKEINLFAEIFRNVLSSY